MIFSGCLVFISSYVEHYRRMKNLIMYTLFSIVKTRIFSDGIGKVFAFVSLLSDDDFDYNNLAWKITLAIRHVARRRSTPQPKVIQFEIINQNRIFSRTDTHCSMCITVHARTVRT